MKATCQTHGETEFRLDKNGNAWCVQCQGDAIADYLKTDEGKARLSDAFRDEMAKSRHRSFSMGPAPVSDVTE